MPKHVIHVNQAVIRANRKTGSRLPTITVKTYKSNRYASEVIIRDDRGVEVARLIYRPDKPLPCGAQVWLETRAAVELVPPGDAN